MILMHSVSLQALAGLIATGFIVVSADLAAAQSRSGSSGVAVRSTPAAPRAPVTSGPSRPPFTATPLGQPLHRHAPMTPNIRTTPTANSPAGGGYGMTRSAGTQAHHGVDDPGRRSGQVSNWHGTGMGVVTRSGPAYQPGQGSLGQRVQIETRDAQGRTWTSTSMHHDRVLVRPGTVVFPGQPIATGSGAGDQFRSPRAGAPHVHWEVRRDGTRVNPLNGTTMPAR